MNPGPTGDSAEIRELKGRPKKKIRKNQEGIPISTRRTPPKRLSPPARAFWRKNAPILMRYGLLTTLDEMAFEILCILYGQWFDAVIMLDTQGLASIDERRLPRKNPVVSIYKGFTSELAIWLRMFGLTPDSRQRLGGIIKDLDLQAYRDQQSKFGRFINDNKKGDFDDDESPFSGHFK